MLHLVVLQIIVFQIAMSEIVHIKHLFFKTVRALDPPYSTTLLPYTHVDFEVTSPPPPSKPLPAGSNVYSSRLLLKKLPIHHRSISQTAGPLRRLDGRQWAAREAGNRK